MKKPNKLKVILSLAVISCFGFNSNAQCFFSEIDSFYCADASTVTLVGSPLGGEFSGPGMSGDVFDPVSAGPGSHTITYSSELKKDNYYLRAAIGEPWGATVNPTAMDLAFGSGEWIAGIFETIDPTTVFSSETEFVFIDGSDNGAVELAAFLTTNISVIEAWVSEGGKLLLNAAPNEGGNINFGFGGSTLIYGGASSSVNVVDLTHPAYLGPNTPLASTMTGSSYSHGHVTGVGFTSVVVNSTDATNIVLCEKSWGSGQVMMGGMTTNNFHSPVTEAANWRANILHYMASIRSHFYLRSNVGEPWSSSSNTEAMNLAFGNSWSLGLFESVDASTVFSSATSFVFIDGSDDGAIELNTFLIDNLELIEDWVNAGGSLLLNSAPNEGGDINFGFNSSTLVFADPSSSVNIADLAHAAYIGPNSPTAATMTGGNYSHGHITGTGFTSVLFNSADATNIVLCEKVWGNGNVMMGGMTTSNYHSPLTEANNYRANLMAYMASLYNGYYCVTTQETTILEPLVISSIIGDELLGDDGSIDITVAGGYPAYAFDWDNDGTGDFDDTEDLSGIEAGTYIINVEDNWGCTATESIVVNSQVGITTNTQIEIKLYPNPTQGETMLEVEGSFTYQLFDINGKIILKGNGFNKEALQLSKLENGVYFIQITAENHNQTIKIVKN